MGSSARRSTSWMVYTEGYAVYLFPDGIVPTGELGIELGFDF